MHPQHPKQVENINQIKLKLIKIKLKKYKHESKTFNKQDKKYTT